MWLLSTDRAEFHFFASPEHVKDGYAIFSHVWDAEEQSFQDLRIIQKKCAKKFTKKGRNPRNFVCEKIRRCCELAESHGYKWVWIDTCCIDKTSSHELSETINSMFRYYSLARICYGYLRDVPYLSDVRVADSPAFVRSNWFRRGWTLQELIAPRFFLFLSQSWHVLGTKSDFASLLECEFGIPATVLRFQASHTEFSIAERMSWFGERKTTRLEDEAYCLLGLFDIRMPPLYGEGSNAFQRLQEEIMKQLADTTLFAWEDIYLADQVHSCLFAPSPSAFKQKGITYTPLRPPQQQQDCTTETTGPDLDLQDGGAEDMTFAVTPHGVLAYIPTITSQNKVFGDLYWSMGSGGSRLLLCLEEDPASQGRSSRRPSYSVCCDRLLQINPIILTADAGYVIDAQPVRPVWREVLIRHRPPPRRLPGELPDTRTSFIPPIPMQLILDAPVRFDEAHIQHFMQESGLELVEVRNADFPWSVGSALQTSYVFADPLMTVKLVIQVGQCLRLAWYHRAPLCAAVDFWTTTELADSDHSWHRCLHDHVSKWPGFRQTFLLTFEDHWNEKVKARVTLSFAPCPINPKRTLVLRASYREVERYRGPRPSSPSSHIPRHS